MRSSGMATTNRPPQSSETRHLLGDLVAQRPRKNQHVVGPHRLERLGRQHGQAAAWQKAALFGWRAVDRERDAIRALWRNN